MRKIIRVEKKVEAAPAAAVAPKKLTPKQALIVHNLRNGSRIIRGLIGESWNSRGSTSTYGHMLCLSGRNNGREVPQRTLDALVERGLIEKIESEVPKFESLGEFSRWQAEPRESYKLTAAAKKA